MDNNIQTAEDERLGGSSPLFTIMRLCTGPLCFALIHGIQDTIDLYIIKKGFNQDGVTVVSISSGLRTLVTLLSSFCGSAVTIKTGELLTKHDAESAGRLFVETIRLGIIFGIIFPFLLLFSGPKILPTLGMPKELESDATKYLAPIFCYPIVVYLNAILNGELMAMGRAILSTIVQLIALGISLACDPLFIWVFKCKVSMMGVAYIAGPTIVCIVMLVLFIAGRFTVKPVWSAFKEKPSPVFWGMLKLSIPMVTMIAFSLMCPLIIVGLVTKASKNIHEDKTIPTIFATATKAYTVLLSCASGSLGGLTPAATWAFHKNNLKRLTALTFSAYILPYAVFAILWPLMVFFPKTVLKIWIDDPNMMQWVPSIAPVMFYSTLVDPINTSLMTLLIVMGSGGMAAIGLIVKNLMLLASGAALYGINKNSPRAVLFCYAFQDISYLICNAVCFVFAFRKSRQQIEDKQIKSNLLSEDTQYKSLAEETQ